MSGKTRTYELLLVLQPEVDPKDTAKVEEITKQLVSDTAKVKDIAILGKKTLAYPIKKHKEGVYVVVMVEAVKMDISQIERKMQLGSQVIRYLLTYKS